MEEIKIRDRIKELRRVPASQLVPSPKNWRMHPAFQRDAIMGVLREVGISDALIGWERRDGKIELIDGHLRQHLDPSIEWPVLILDVKEAEAAKLLASIDPISAMAETDRARLDSLLGGIRAKDEGFSEFLDRMRAADAGVGGGDGGGGGGGAGSIQVEVPRPSLAERFLIPPFSVLDARQGVWQDRKRQWLALGIKSEGGRDGNLLGMSKTILEPDPEKRAEMEAAGANFEEAGGGTSVFDPVLCELAYRWFSPPDGVVLDPFAGGSVRGIVAALLGRHYVGIELREEQVAANNEQAEQLCGDGIRPYWIAGESSHELNFGGRRKGQIPGALQAPADLIFSCPPYGSLERYSDDPRDLSAMALADFRAMYAIIISRALERLRPDRFACFVVGDYRDEAGCYCNLPAVTIEAFESSGARLYNEAVLVTSVGNVSMRAARPFVGSRKLGKVHQNVLIFVKGDPKKAAEACGHVDVADLGDAFGEPVSAERASEAAGIQGGEV